MNLIEVINELSKMEESEALDIAVNQLYDIAINAVDDAVYDYLFYKGIVVSSSDTEIDFDNHTVVMRYSANGNDIRNGVSRFNFSLSDDNEVNLSR